MRSVACILLLWSALVFRSWSAPVAAAAPAEEGTLEALDAQVAELHRAGTRAAMCPAASI